MRKRPAMYIGDTSSRGLHHLVEEVVMNSIDEAVMGFCQKVAVRLNVDGSVAVVDDGRGIPVDMHKEEGRPAVEVIMTTLHAGGKFENVSYKAVGGLHGVGVSVVNALSEWLEVEVRRDGCAWFQRYEQGERATPLEQKGKIKRTGTKIVFKPDTEIFDAAEIDYDVITARLRELAFLNKGIRITVADERNGQEEEFYYKGGIKAFVQHLNRNRQVIHPDICYIEKESQGVILEIAFQYNDGYAESVFSFANNINTHEGGTHLSGFRSALTRTLNAYGRAQGVFKDGPVPSGDDYKEGLTAVVSVKVPDPQFEGQTKTKLGNREVQGIVESFTNEQLGIYCEEHPSSIKRIVRKTIEAAQAREAARKARELARRKTALSGGNLPAELADCSSRDVESTELFLVEGISAGGTAKLGRDRRFQAILPLRGVVLNVEKARIDKILSNEAIRTLVAALGTGIGVEEFDIKNVRYGKIIIMTDADVDGAHIRTLLLTLFFRQMPQLIDAGGVYVAQPPLYKVKRKGKEEFVFDDRRLRETLRRLGLEGASLRWGEHTDERIDGAAVESLIDQLIQLEEHARILGLRGTSIDQFIAMRREDGSLPSYRAEIGGDVMYFYTKEEAEKEAKARKVELVDQEDIANGSGKDAMRIVGVHESREISRSLTALQKAGFSAADYLGEGERTFAVMSGQNERAIAGLRELPTAIRDIGREGMDIQRYKGLGEMNADELAQTTMNPEDRTLVRITVGEAAEADRMFSILAGKEVQPRREYIERHALEVKNLDI